MISPRNELYSREMLNKNVSVKQMDFSEKKQT